MHPLPAGLQTVPNACANVPANPWCSGQVTTVESCASSQFVPVLLELSFGEQFVSVSVAGEGGVFRTVPAAGRRTTITVDLGDQVHGTISVHFVEHIKVASNNETISFTRIYHRC